MKSWMSFGKLSVGVFFISVLSLFLVFGFTNQVCASSEIENTIDTLAKELREFLPRTESDIRVAVFPFNREDTNEVTAFSRYIQDTISTSLIADRYLTVINRHKLDKFLEELNFQQSDLIDSTKRISLGHFSEANVLLLGSYWDLGDQVKVSVQLFYLESADAIGAGKCFISKKLIRPDWLGSGSVTRPIEVPIEEPSPEPVPRPPIRITIDETRPSDEEMAYAMEELSRELKERAKKVAQANHPASKITRIVKNNSSSDRTYNRIKVTEVYSINMKGAILGLRKFKLLVQVVGEISFVGKSINRKILEGNALSDEEY